jgi:hypothetical protein
MNPGHTLAPPSTVTTLTLSENIFVNVIFVIITSVCFFGQLTESSSLVGACFAVVVFAFVVVRTVVAVTVTASVILESAVAEVRNIVVVVVAGAGLVVIDGAFGGTITDDDSFVLYAGFLYVTVSSVVTLFKVNVALRSVSNKSFPSRVELRAFEVVVESVTKETVSCIGFLDKVAVFVLHGEATVDRLSCIIMLVVSNEREVFIIELDPVRTVFQSS